MENLHRSLSRFVLSALLEKLVCMRRMYTACDPGDLRPLHFNHGFFDKFEIEIYMFLSSLNIWTIKARIKKETRGNIST